MTVRLPHLLARHLDLFDQPGPERAHVALTGTGTLRVLRELATAQVKRGDRQHRLLAYDPNPTWFAGDTGATVVAAGLDVATFADTISSTPWTVTDDLPDLLLAAETEVNVRAKSGPHYGPLSSTLVLVDAHGAAHYTRHQLRVLRELLDEGGQHGVHLVLALPDADEVPESLSVALARHAHDVPTAATTPATSSPIRPATA